jgi:4-amino-4-deoxy-L-arabinose transferase-like glycosyltransferase
MIGKLKLDKIAPAATILIILSINLFFGLPRLANFSAVDEHLWTYNRIPQYWKAIKEQQWKKTNINDKPGITVALISGAGLLKIDSKAYKYLRLEPKNEADLRAIEKVNFYFRLPIYLFTLLMAPVFYFLIKKLTNAIIALFSVSMIYLSPILLGISLIINPDSLLWVFMPLCLLSFLVFQKTQIGKYAYLSGLFLGLSLLTKYVASILFVFLPLIIILDYIFHLNNRKDEEYFKVAFSGYIKAVLISLLVISLLYPAIWVKSETLLSSSFLSHPFEPIFPAFLAFFIFFFTDTLILKNKLTKTILVPFVKYKEIILQLVALSGLLGIIFVLFNTYLGMKIYDFETLLELPKLASSSPFALGEFLGGIFSGIYVMIFSIYPLIFLLFLFAILSFFRKNISEHKEIFISFYFLIFILVYYVASAFNQIDATVRYQISIYPLVSIVAAIGLYKLINIEKIKKNFSPVLVNSLIVIFLAFSLFLIRPHYFAYASSLLPKSHIVNVKDMGDGSFEAAQYLNSLPDAKNISIWSDKMTVCESFMGKCSYSLKNTNIVDMQFDYFVISRGRKTKSLFFTKIRDIKIDSFIDLNKYYSTDSSGEHEIKIDGRPGNFIKIIKNGNES